MLRIMMLLTIIGVCAYISTPIKEGIASGSMDEIVDTTVRLSNQDYYKFPKPYIAYTDVVPRNKDNMLFEYYNDLITNYDVNPPSKPTMQIPGMFTNIKL